MINEQDELEWEDEVPATVGPHLGKARTRSYTFIDPAVTQIEQCAKRLSISEDDVMERAVGLYIYVQKVFANGGELHAHYEDREVKLTI